MKLTYQIVVAAVLLLILGVSGADCLVPSAQMTLAERACCQQMAGQCDMNTVAKDSCCQKIVQRHDDMDLRELLHFVPQTLTLQVKMLGLDLSPRVSMPSFIFQQQLGDPAHSPPAPSIEILRI